MNVAQQPDQAGGFSVLDPENFKLDLEDFELFRRLIKKSCGIKVTDTKRILLQNRIGKRLRDLGLKSFREYYDRTVGENNGDEIIKFWSAITTNVTSFFREAHHFEALTEDVLPRLVSVTGRKKLRIWSAGCSTGQEPYTLAMVLCDYFSDKVGCQFKILGTDIDVNVLSQAQRAEYRIESMDPIPLHYHSRFIEKDNSWIRVAKEIRESVSFRHQNLLTPEDSAIKFDVIFCRNTIMYFDTEFRRKLMAHFNRSLNEGGCLFLGSSEGLIGSEANFRRKKFGKSIYYEKVTGEQE
jgi:chemotaxis protein methyltransferase CheR